MQKQQMKELNPTENKELVEMKDKIQNLRHQVGLFDEQMLELDAQKKQAHNLIQSQKQAFRDRVQNIAKSYDVVLGQVRDGKLWQFDEANLLFVQTSVQVADQPAE